MKHFKRYFKLIFSTLAAVVCFCCFPLVAHADPLTGAMIGSAISSGFSFPGFASLGLPSSEALIGGFFTDLVPWGSLVQAGQAYLTIRDLLGSDNVEVTLSPELSTAGYNRTQQLNNHYGLEPGSVYQLGSYKCIDGYVFNRPINPSNEYFAGPQVGTVPSDYVIGSSNTYNVSSNIFITLDVEESKPTSFYAQQTIGSFVSTRSTWSGARPDRPIFLTIAKSSGEYKLTFATYNESLQSWSGFTYGTYTPGIPITTNESSISRNNSAIVDSDGRSNKIVIPKSFVNNIEYTSGETISTEDIVKAVLDALSEAGFLGQIVESGYDDPIDPPVPPASETIAETAYSILNETFNDFKEIFGDIYGDIVEFKESFGDWVNDVASGWTEIFGDIYNDLHQFRESFGDWVDDVASGWTEVFGDIFDTLKGWRESFGDFADTVTSAITEIVDSVSDIVESIKEGDFEFIDGFWKNFQTPFMPFFNTIKQHLGIWHYVVEWLNSISSAFTFFFGVMSNTGYNFVLPIYAAFAGTVVLAVYKRFGK